MDERPFRQEEDDSGRGDDDPEKERRPPRRDNRRQACQGRDRRSDVLPVCLTETTDERATNLVEPLPGSCVRPAGDPGLDPAGNV